MIAICVVLLISRPIKGKSKANRRGPAYSRALRQINEAVQWIMGGRGPVATEAK